MSRTKTSTARAGRPAAKGPAQTAAPRKGGARQSPANLDEAIAQAQHGRVNLTPEKAVQMAAKLYSENRFAQAERVCRQVLEARPGNADAHNILGATLQGLGRTAEAIAELRIAIKLAPRAANLRANLGELLRQSGQREEAAAELEKAVEIDPGNAQALNNRRFGVDMLYPVQRYIDGIENQLLNDPDNPSSASRAQPQESVTPPPP